MPWLTIPDGNVSVSNSGAGTLAHSGGVFTATNTYGNSAAAGDVLSAPGGTPNYFVIDLPAGYDYTGNTRLTITTATMAVDAYDHVVFNRASSPPFSGAAIGAGTYESDIGPLVAGTDIYCAAGYDDGGGGTGVYEFTLEFEYEELPDPEFWTGFIGCREIPT